MHQSRKERRSDGAPGMAIFAEKLRKAELRVTQPRVGILWAVQANPHADTDTIFGVVRAALSEVSRQTVYDVLNTLTEVGLLRRFQPSGSVARYETRVGDNHHHFVCRSCGAIADVDCAVGEAPCLIASGDLGFFVEESEVIFWGLCVACSGARRAGGPDPAGRAWTGRDHIFDHDFDGSPDEAMLRGGQAWTPSTRAAFIAAAQRGYPFSGGAGGAAMRGGPSGSA